MHIQPQTFSEFQQQALHGNVIPVAESILADLLTPVSAYLRLCKNSEDSFLLESVDGGENVARYSFLGHNPREWIKTDGRTVTVRTAENEQQFDTDIFSFLKSMLTKYKFVSRDDLPRFSGGLVGFFGYDTVRLIEDLPQSNPVDTKEIIASFGLYDTVLAFDHLRQQIIIIANAIIPEGGDLQLAYKDALQRIQETRETLRQPAAIESRTVRQHTNVHANFKKENFYQAVKTAIEYIRAGDIFQVVLSQQFSRAVAADPFDIYRALRLINPSPYLFYLQNQAQAIIGASPEMLVRVEDREVTVRPIAGTRPRGKSIEEDLRLEKELLADEKERAEHVMLMDLGRNDVGRVAEYGGVIVTENMVIERYSHVMHIVSEVRGKLRPEFDAIDAFKACFPAGTLSGAPKVRAMEIIEELEPNRRGVYGGALGYIDFSGNMDTCITIRTLEVRAGMAYFQAGAGIVADSVPESEFAETVHKSNAVRSAIALAEAGLDNL
ncbi:MAG: anthranilate synthase component I [Calditrichaeota bacterium]|nr:MAG: anthranilate synthase component I [Calditrichota bacterium]